MDLFTPQDLLTPQELAAQWRVSVATVYRVIGKGLPVVRLHDKGDVRIRRSDAERWLDERVAVAK